VLERAVLAIFRLGGMLVACPDGGEGRPRLGALVFKGLIACVMGCIFLETCVEVALARLGTCASAMLPTLICSEEERLTTEVLIAGAAFALILLLGLLRGERRLDDLMAMLQGYAHHHELWELWQRSAVCDLLIMLATFLCAVALHISEALRYDGPDVASKWAHTGMNIAVVSMLMVTLTFLLYVLRMLVVTVDVFCFKSVLDPNIPRATESWNILQALLRKASTVVELGLLVLLVMTASTVPAFILDHVALGSFSKTLRLQLPHILVVCGVLHAFMIAAAVTDKCMRVPALINSLSFGPGKERQRQHLVEYILYSAAGFYICDVRLTIGMVTKFIYVWFVILFAFVGRELTQE